MSEPRFHLAPSVLSFDLPDLKPSLATMASGGADWIHFDVMDGQFVPPITFGDSFVRALRPVVTTPFEVHLMTETPDRQFEPFVAAGCGRVIFHVEATAHAHRLCQTLRSMGVQPGIALNPGTPVEAALPLLDLVDLVLVMTVNPGWGGQKFLPETLSKLRTLRAARPDLALEVDGGVGPATIGEAHQAGADTFVVGNVLATSPDLARTMQELRARCGV